MALFGEYRSKRIEKTARESLEKMHRAAYSVYKINEGISAASGLERAARLTVKRGRKVALLKDAISVYRQVSDTALANARTSTGAPASNRHLRIHSKMYADVVRDSNRSIAGINMELSMLGEQLVRT